MLMSDVGGDNDLSHTAITVDDEAPTAFPDEDPLGAGSYRPTDADGANDDFPAPAPTPVGTPALSVFDGTNPNGTWRLFAYDPEEEDLVQVDDWTLDIEYVEKVAPSGSVSIAGARPAPAARRSP